MKKLSFFLIFIYLVKRFFLPMPVWASETAGTSAVLVEMVLLQTVDIRPRQLEDFFNSYNRFAKAPQFIAGDKGKVRFQASLETNSKAVESLPRKTLGFQPREAYNSPLAAYSEYFVQVADKYNIDWRLVPAITGIESTFGKNIPFNSYNAYGWDGGNARFDSWEESIEAVSKNLKEKYYGRGLNTPFKIAPVYCPPSKVWAGKVVFFMEKIGDFEKEAWLKITPLMM